jgi:phospholipase D1/2
LRANLAERPLQQEQPAGLLQPGKNCWRIEPARRAAVLVDAAAYFGALRSAMLKAERSILIVGWDIDSRAPLLGEDFHADDGLPQTLCEFLCALVAQKPALRVKMLLWDYSVLYSLERELLPVLSLQWRTPPQIELCLDDVLPIGSAHHQKIVVIDDLLAFSGGLDLAIRRWDTSAHALADERRRDPADRPYRPFHDVQIMVDGKAAAALAELARWRWERGACERLRPLGLSGDRWPEGVAPDFRDVAIGIARTLPPYDGVAEVREVEALFVAMIGAAERWLYIENQFLTCSKLAPLLVRRLQEQPALEVLIVGPKTHESWLEQRTMLNGRIRFMRTLRDAGVGDRVRLVHPAVRQGGRETDVMVHSKVLAVDDRLIRIGSANLNNRSMGTDSECDLAIEARNDRERAAVLNVLARLAGEHCGATPAAMRAALADTGSLFAAVDRLATPERFLKPIDDGDPEPNEFSAPVEAVADPERPIGAEMFLADLTGEKPRRGHLPSLVKAGIVALVVVALVLAWRYTPLAELADPDWLRARMADIAEASWGPVVVIAVYVVAGLVAFPVMLLIAVTAATFGAWPGMLYAAAGSIASALVTYLIGRQLGADLLRNLLGPRINRISRGIARRGVLAVAAIRLVPVAPFTLVNLVAGASRVRPLDYFVGTALGMAPGIALMSTLGSQVFDVLSDPSWTEGLLFVALIAVWVGISLAFQLLVTRLRRSD